MQSKVSSIKTSQEVLRNKKIAIVCDWIKDWWGAEKVLEELMTLFPTADIFTSIFFPENMSELFNDYARVSYKKVLHTQFLQDRSLIEKWTIFTSFIQNIPFLARRHKLCLALRQNAFEDFDLSGYDIVISSNSAESKWVITKPQTLHICYCHTPTRYFWWQYEEYKDRMEFGVFNILGKYIFSKMIQRFRRWDYAAAQRPDEFIANSKNTQQQIKEYYKRASHVIYPPVEVTKFQSHTKKKNFYLSVGRCIPYKKFDLLVDTFNTNGEKLVLITNTDNALYRKLKKKSRSNITWKLHISQKETQTYFESAKAFLFPPQEDFGIVPLEAMAAGCPVIAYGKWWALETVVPWKTGVFFDEQTPESLQKAIDICASMTFDPQLLREHAERFSSDIFRENILHFIEEKIRER